MGGREGRAVNAGRACGCVRKGLGCAGKPGLFVGGPSGPMLLSQIAANGPESVGPEGPPTNPRPDPEARSGEPGSKKPGQGRNRPSQKARNPAEAGIVSPKKQETRPRPGFRMRNGPAGT
ncbi:DUF6053 domain-containing protein [Lysobacter enzymogenes]|uniref:DUF6053 domain-containing protein n=1 Tax=Lysobacter enzymogenes TaxID=69 RepID=UPI003D18BE19